MREGGVTLHDIRFYRDSSGVQPAKEYIRKLQNQKRKIFGRKDSERNR